MTPKDPYLKIKSVEDIAGALSKIKTLIECGSLTKRLFRTMLTGFKILVKSLEREDSKPFNIVIKWLSLYLQIQNVLNPNDEKCQHQFEQSVPPAVTFVIGCLQFNPKDIKNYHFKILVMIQRLLENVKESTVRRVANFDLGIIGYLWLPIDFVGDFNTQLLALRLLSMLLKCSEQKQQEMDTICLSRATALKNDLTTAIEFTNYPSCNFENVARKLLNNYNMNASKNIMVYSFRCKAFQFGEQVQFYKKLGVNHFWIDLNYCPSTLTFKGCCKNRVTGVFENIDVVLDIKNMELNDKLLTVRFKAPAPFSESLNWLNELKTIDLATIELPEEEVFRLQENTYVLNFFKAHLLGDMPNENELVASTPIEDAVCNFQNSYNFLVGCSDERNDVDFNAINKLPILDDTSALSKILTTTKSTGRTTRRNLSLKRKSIEPDNTCTPKSRRFFQSSRLSTQWSNTSVTAKKATFIRKSRAIKVFSSLPPNNKENRINKSKPRKKVTSAIDANENGMTRFIVYEDLNVSDAEPGKSYRHFKSNRKQTEAVATSPRAPLKRRCRNTSNYAAKRIRAVDNRVESAPVSLKTKRSVSKSNKKLSNEPKQNISEGVSLPLKSFSQGRTSNSMKICLKNRLLNGDDNYALAATELAETQHSDGGDIMQCRKEAFEFAKESTIENIDVLPVLFTNVSPLNEPLPQDSVSGGVNIHDESMMLVPNNVSTTRNEIKTKMQFLDTSIKPIELNASYSNMLNCVTYQKLLEGSSDMINCHKQYLETDLVKTRNREKGGCIDSYLRKAVDITKRIMLEVGNQRSELQELETGIERCVRQLVWKYGVYQKQANQFNRFKENMENLLNSVTQISIEEEIDKEHYELMSELQKSSQQIRTKIWQDFVNKNAEMLFNNISQLSNI